MFQNESSAEQAIFNTTLDVNSKIHTIFKPNANFVPPGDFALLLTLQEHDYTNDDYQYKDFLPYVTLTSEPALTPYEHIDVATRADPKKKALFAAIPNRKDMTPNMGTEVHGIQLSQLTDKQKDEMALYVAERGLVVFRDQDFVDQGIEWLKEFGSYFGQLHTHQWGPHPKGDPDLDISFRNSAKGTYLDDRAEGALNTLAWHTDMSYEVNSPCTTFLCSLPSPECGGDTLYVNCMTAYDRMSPPIQQFLEGLSAVHPGTAQSLLMVKSLLARRPTIDTVHPVLRKHPVIGRKALWVNKGHTAKIAGVRKPESDMLLNFLYDHIHRGIDFQTRVKWEKGTVAVYDNRMVQHSVTMDYALGDGAIRHLVRVTAQGERPAL